MGSLGAAAWCQCRFWPELGPRCVFLKLVPAVCTHAPGGGLWPRGQTQPTSVEDGDLCGTCLSGARDRDHLTQEMEVVVLPFTNPAVRTVPFRRPASVANRPNCFPRRASLRLHVQDRSHCGIMAGPVLAEAWGLRAYCYVRVCQLTVPRARRHGGACVVLEAL